MKELTIEEKTKAYDGTYKTYTELINRLEDVKNAIKKQNYGIAMDILCKPYPEFQIIASTELKESEDEKIRKALIKLVKKVGEGYENVIDGVSIENAISWLEKQGEHANFRNKIQVGDKVTRNEDGVLVNLSQLNRVAKKQGEQKPIPKFKVGDVVRSSNGASLLIVGITDYCYNCVICATNDKYSFGFDIQDEFELVEQTSSWSEEDEEIHRKCICAMRASACGFPEEEKFVEQVDNWLKSLKDRVQPQSQWKPSVAQIEALNYVVNLMASSESPKENDYYYNVLKDLREQLKKL
jgi:hypothetical protein